MHGLQSLKIVERRTIDMLEVFGCLPGIESLNLGFCFSMHLAVGNIPERLPTSFNHLKSLSIAICLDDFADVACALWLIKSSPYLQELFIKVVYMDPAPARDSVVEFLEFQNRSDVSLYRLKEISMGSLVGSKPEIGFVKLLLAKSPLLETMYISRMPELPTNEAHSLLKEIALFRRASSLAEILFM